MAYPFRPMTNDILKKLSRAIRDCNSREKYSKSADDKTILKIRPIEELNPQRPEVNQSQLPHL